MLWRQLDAEGGAFTDYDDARAFAAETNSGDSVRVDGVPGEFFLVEVEPGDYALDSVFGRLRDGRIDYIAQGVVRGPERPSIALRAGEAVYLGIWQLRLDNGAAVARPWRLSPDDLAAITRLTRNLRGAVVLRAAEMREIPCTPHRMSSYTPREIC